MVLGSTQPLTEMSTRSISRGQRRPVRKADNLPPSCAVVTKSVSLNFLEPSGPFQAYNGTALPLSINLSSISLRYMQHFMYLNFLRRPDRGQERPKIINIKIMKTNN